MNILYLTGCLSIGGTELYTMDYAKTVQSAGQTVYWATVRDGLFRETVEKNNIPLLYCELGKRSPIAFLRAQRQLRHIVEEYDVDLIHAIDAYSALVAALAFKGENKKHKLIWSNVGIGSASYALMRRLCDKRIDGYIAVSHFIRNRMIEEGFDPERIAVYSQNRETPASTKSREAVRAYYGIEHEDFVIGTVGRLVPLKGNRTVIDALALVTKTYPRVKLLLVGDGPDRQTLMQRAEALGLMDHVIFAGFCNDVENFYPAFDLVAFPTYYEALGYIPYEAMHHGKPIVASLTGGVPELVIDGYNGLLVPPAMPEQWADAIIRMVESEDLRNKVAENGNAFYQQNLARNDCETKLLMVYKKLMSINKEK